jgi:hypothetical protein
MARFIAALALIVALAACSHGSGGGGTPHGSASLSTLAAGIGCTFVEDTEQHELYTSDQGACGAMTLYSFANTHNRDSWLDAAQGFGGNFLVSGRWVATADNPADLTKAQAKVGGGLR